jgi:hypothetical protein
MTKIYAIGDCHISRVQEHYNPSESDVDFVIWGKAAKKIWDINFAEMLTLDEVSSGKEQQRFDGDGVTLFSQIKDEDVLFAWFGYVDIRTFLSKYNNADEVAKRYVDQLKSYFKNSLIVIIEPLPQFTEMLLKYEGISPSYTYEERLNQNKLFIESLHKYASYAGITHFITQDDIRKAIGSDELTPAMTHTKAPHPVDGLKDEYNQNIFFLFERYAKKIIEENFNDN